MDLSRFSMSRLRAQSVSDAFLLVDDEEEDEEEDEVEGEGETNKEESSEGSKDGDTIFIPLGFAYKLPKTYYKGTDPEWQSFVELSKNKKLCDFLRSTYL
ncbi:MAG: hypothetical protein L6R39_002494 [Caloplaca ligustica]|nr:MAG: hypothetical protein L6R39_002494 [Caloplaca ligustica]